MKAGQVRANLSVVGEVLVVVAMWTLVSVDDGAAVWRVSESLDIWPGEAVREVRCWTMYDEGTAKTLLPRQYC